MRTFPEMLGRTCMMLEGKEGSALVEAEEISSRGEPAPADEESFTWTFYKFRTRAATAEESAATLEDEFEKLDRLVH